jgi:hypothetical protein
VEASGAGSYDNHAQPFDDHVGLSDDGAGDTCAGANRQHPGRQLQHHVSGKGVQTEVSKQKASRQKVAKREQPEPWLAPKYKSPRGTQKHVRVPKLKTLNPPGAAVPSSVYVPQTGRTFQNLPTLPGSGPGGAETFQDRAMRCSHQAGVYGQVGANRGTYMGSCL